MIDSWMACVRRGRAPSLPASWPPCVLALRLALAGFYYLCASAFEDLCFRADIARDTPSGVAGTPILTANPRFAPPRSWKETPECGGPHSAIRRILGGSRAGVGSAGGRGQEPTVVRAG